MRPEQAPQGDTRVILHIDLDCFYAQVEQVRLGIPRDVPVAVQQWEGLIAVNYAARAKGITRHMRVGEAKIKCPDLVCVHVETLGGGGAASEEPPRDTAADDNSIGAGGSTTAIDRVDRLTQKACLERYRRANSEILKILHKLAPTSVIEKASIDEVYIDVTAMVDSELQGKYNYHKFEGGGVDDNKFTNHNSDNNKNLEASPSDAFSWGSIVPSGPLNPGSEFDVRLACGAGIACRLRGAILEKLGYTSSAGIATNKLLAKIGSALHKPNLQTVIPPRAVDDLMKDLPLKKVKNFGGKLGQKLEEQFGCTTAGAVAAVPLESLIKLFGAEKARWIVDAVHGWNNDPVEEKEKPRSMLAAKSFNPTSDTASIQRWIAILAAELAPRMASDEDTFRRRARTLSVHFRGGNAPNQDRTRQAAMPKFSGNGVPCVETISRTAWEIFKMRCAGEGLPCVRLGISAGDFAELPVQGKSAITNFLVAREKPSSGGRDEGEKGNHDGPNNGSKRPLEPSTAARDGAVPKGGEDCLLPYPKIAKEKKEDGQKKSCVTIPVSAAPGEEKGKEKEEEEEEEEAVVLPEELLRIVDIAEQRRLLKEATMLKALEDGKNRGSNGGGGGKGGNKGGGKGGQSNISRFFIRKS
ncbi:hypothetical protein Ndes2526B_g01087 [Nannochloris sp. 'desiccata']